MKAIQVGLGDFGFSWLKDILLHSDNVELIGVVDKNEELLNKARALISTNNIQVFTDISDALAALKPDFILNFTPPAVHKRINFAAFEHGIPVLSEKPIAEDYRDAVEIFEKASESNTPIMIAENYRYSSIVRRARNLIASGEIGRIDAIYVDFSRNHKMTNYHKDLEHPLLLDVSIHHIDMIRYLTGAETKSVFARSWTPEWSWYKGYSNLDLIMEMDNNTKISYRGSLAAFANETDWLADWRIEGQKGVIKMSKGSIIIYKGQFPTEIKVDEVCDSRKAVLNEFISAILKGEPGETDISDNIKTSEIVGAAIEAIKSGEVIRLEKGV